MARIEDLKAQSLAMDLIAIHDNSSPDGKLNAPTLEAILETHNGYDVLRPEKSMSRELYDLGKHGKPIAVVANQNIGVVAFHPEVGIGAANHSLFDQKYLEFFILQEVLKNGRIDESTLNEMSNNGLYPNPIIALSRRISRAQYSVNRALDELEQISGGQLLEDISIYIAGGSGLSLDTTRYIKNDLRLSINERSPKILVQNKIGESFIITSGGQHRRPEFKDYQILGI